jgi:hypothetical protein
MISRDRDRIQGRRFCDVRFPVAGAIERPRERAVQQTGITHTGRAAMFRQLLVMDSENVLAR